MISLSSNTLGKEKANLLHMFLSAGRLLGKPTVQEWFKNEGKNKNPVMSENVIF